MAVLVLLVASAFATIAWGQGPLTQNVPKKTAATSLPEVPAITPAFTAADVEAFLDGLIPQQLQREDVAGAVVMIVKDGKVLFSKGYGYSDVSKRTPVSAENTLFRPASISKLFTWTAVMQLQEQGKLDLDRDVNDYLDFKIPAKFGKPLTLRNILMHRSGFQESIKDLYVWSPGHLQPLGEYLKTHMPEQVFAPGEVPAYSNYAACVAGYIVERVSGQPFEEYVEDHIFKPLGMAHSTFRQPPPDALRPLVSNGYKQASTPARPLELNQAPQGGISLSAADMGRFLIAHLQDGEFEGERILKADTAELMHARQTPYHPALDAMCLGFYEESRNGHRIISHAGATQLFYSDLHLMPDQNLGFFVSYNSMGKGENTPSTVLWHKLLDRYYPYQPPAFGEVASRLEDARKVTGYYQPSRGFETNYFKLFSTLSQLKVSAEPDGILRIEPFKDVNGQFKRWEEIGPLLYREVNGQARVGFQPDPSGRMVLSLDYPFFVFRRVSGLQTRFMTLLILLGSSLVLVVSLVVWPIGASIRRHYGHALGLTSPQRCRRLIARSAPVFMVLSLLAISIFAVSVSRAGMPTHESDPWIRVIQFLALLGVLGTVFALYDACLTWTEKEHWLWTKIGTTLVALAAVGMTWFMFSYHILHWSLNY